MSQLNLISGAFQCHNGVWIPFRWICDAENDCPSGEDEENCAIAEYPTNNESNYENAADNTLTGL